MPDNHTASHQNKKAKLGEVQFGWMVSNIYVDNWGKLGLKWSNRASYQSFLVLYHSLAAPSTQPLNLRKIVEKKMLTASYWTWQGI